MYNHIPSDERDTPAVAYGPLRGPITVEEEELQQLQYNQRTFMGFKRSNSSIYNDVIVKLKALVERFNQPIFSVGADEIQKQDDLAAALRTTLSLYENLISSCSTYLNERAGYRFTSSGEARFKLIENICGNAKKESQVLERVNIKH